MGGSGSTTGKIRSGLKRFVGYGMFQPVPTAYFDYFTSGAGVSLINLSTTATYSISTNFDDAVAAIPKPGTWALMLLGFGMIGYARRGHMVAFA